MSDVPSHNPYAVGLDPDTWEADGLFDEPGLTLAQAKEMIPGIDAIWDDSVDPFAGFGPPAGVMGATGGPPPGVAGPGGPPPGFGPPPGVGGPGGPPPDVAGGRPA